ncbi:MAG: hypothetical protein EXQ95_04390 [Alphaproteobacteria bacterium]|nr:hypothetical protein [Alphaproteobacteria bacterium]
MDDAFDPAMTRMAAAAAFWVVLHVVLAGSPLRWLVAGRIGENGFRALFSALSAIGIVWMAIAYRQATSPDSFYGMRLIEPWMLWAPAVVMAPALILFVGSLTQPNPTMVMGERHLAAAEPARGVLRITRHPMLWTFLLWAAAHFVANGDLASYFLFGSIMLVAAAGMGSIDRKQARRDPEGWKRFAAVTSVVPFVAILTGKNRLALEEIGWGRLGVAAALWVAIVAIHPLVFGAAALP